MDFVSKQSEIRAFLYVDFRQLDQIWTIFNIVKEYRVDFIVFFIYRPTDCESVVCF